MARRLRRGWSWAGLLALALCSVDAPSTPRTGVLLVVPDDADPLTERLATATAGYLATIAAEPVEPLAVDPAEIDSLADLQALAADRHAGLVVVLQADRLAPDRIDATRLADLGPSGFVLETHDLGTWRNGLDDDEPGATIVLTAGGARLSRQYAAYELLRRLGVRFFHPEQEHVPVHAPHDLRALARRPTVLHRDGPDYRPDFEYRAWSFHKPHPLEHLEAFSDPEHPIDEAVHVNEWIVKNFGNAFRGAGRGVVSDAARAKRAAELEALRQLLGFPRGASLSLHNLQQGANAEIDLDAEASAREQIETLVRQRLEDTPDARAFGIHFGATEFTTTPDEQTVQWLNWAGRAALQAQPGVRVEINDHITGKQPSPHFDDLGCPNGTNDQGRADYYDLAFHTDPRLGVQVHTVMFHPLEGPARVYNQRSFAHKLCLIRQASAQGRPIKWFPEGSWWLSFDNPIPVYLPLYIDTRAQDIALLRPLLAARGGGTVYGHRMFNSGQEWGYWQQDYAVGLMAWNADVTVPQVLGEIFDPLCAPAAWREGCAARTEAIAILQEVIAHQREMFLTREDVSGRPGGVYAYFAGEDDADAIAADSGFEFRPVRVSFDAVLGWEAARLEHFEQTDLAALDEAAQAYAGWQARLEALTDATAAAGRPWLSEVRDGVAIDGLRAAQTAALYRAVVALRRARLDGVPRPVEAARPHLLEAGTHMREAERVIRRRESAYRYPAAQTHGGGLTPDTAVPNGTPYAYRVHTKTHLLTYWHNRHDEVSRILEGAEHAGLQLSEAIDRPGVPLRLRWPEEGMDGTVQVGETTLDPSTTELLLGPVMGRWIVRGPSPGVVVRSDVLAQTPKKGMTLRAPEDRNAKRVLRSVLPALRWAWVEAIDGEAGSGAALVFGPDADGDGSVPHGALVSAAAEVRVEGRARVFSTEPVAFPLPIALGSGGTRLSIGVSEAVLHGRIEDGALVEPLIIEAEISIDDLVTAAEVLAGFDRKGILVLLSGIWGFDADDPPSAVPIEAELQVTPVVAEASSPAAEG